MAKNILIILGHPDASSYCSVIAETYKTGSKEAKNQVKYFRLCDLRFDQNLHSGYKNDQPLEPDIKEVQDAILWANHIVMVYPIWWGSMPAILKGFLDRVLLPGFAFQYRDGSQLWDRLLVGRSAHVIMTLDTPPWYYRLVYKQPGVNQIKKTILEFCGIKPVKTTLLGPIRYVSDKKKKKWLQQIVNESKSI